MCQWQQDIQAKTPSPSTVLWGLLRPPTREPCWVTLVARSWIQVDYVLRWSSRSPIPREAYGLHSIREAAFTSEWTLMITAFVAVCSMACDFGRAGLFSGHRDWEWAVNSCPIQNRLLPCGTPSLSPLSLPSSAPTNTQRDMASSLPLCLCLVSLGCLLGLD